jgi:hypothetical protein
MTNKQKIQNLVDRMPEDVTFEQAIYRIVLLKKVEIGLKQMNEGRLIDHDELFDRLLKDEKGRAEMDRPSGSRPARNKKHNRKGPAAQRRQVRTAQAKVSR